MKDRVLQYIDSHPWAISEEALGVIRGIAARHVHGDELDVAAIEKELGRPLDHTREVRVRDGVAVVPVHGPLFRYANLFTRISGATSMEELANDVSAAVRDRAVRAVVLDIDSPGGEVNGTQELAELIFRARGEKEMVAMFSGLGTSGAYWLGSAASHVVVGSTGILGSIGTLLRTQKRDDDEIVFVSSQSPRKYMDPGKEGGQADIQALLDSLAQVFIETVAVHRGVTPETVEQEFGQGGLFVGEDAVKAGLADRVDSLESVISEFTGRGRFPALAKPSASAASTLEDDDMPHETNPSAENQGPEITRDYLAANHSDLVAEIRSEGEAEARTAGATAERERILGIQEMAGSEHAELVAQLTADPAVTVEQAAMKLVKAGTALNAAHLAALKADEAELGAPGPAAHGGAQDADPTPEQKADRALAAAGIRRPSNN